MTPHKSQLKISVLAWVKSVSTTTQTKHSSIIISSMAQLICTWDRWTKIRLSCRQEMCLQSHSLLKEDIQILSRICHKKNTIASNSNQNSWCQTIRRFTTTTTKTRQVCEEYSNVKANPYQVGHRVRIDLLVHRRTTHKTSNIFSSTWMISSKLWSIQRSSELKANKIDASSLCSTNR